jgi:GDP/UDP-N,N'-diacetylbacillosamine 2-epimerase (hydrolysing)
MKGKVCVVTSTRAEFGLLSRVMQGVRDDPSLVLQIIATGMHLSPEFGLTYREIEKEGFQINRKIEMLTSSDTTVGVAKSMGLGMIGMADALDELSPDLILVLGDRFEILSAVATALIARIPVMHLHGGELTHGAIDDSIRHAISKMSHVHCVATEEYRQRLIQLGENPQRIFCVGGLGVDVIKNTSLLNREELEIELDFKLMDKNLLITFHPATLSIQTAKNQMMELVAALEPLRDTGLIFTLPNADSGGRELISILKDFTSRHTNARLYPSLGRIRYLSCMSQCDGVVGNSSSGLLEAPTLKKGVINIGERQSGRKQANNVINTKAERVEIADAIRQLQSSSFQESLKGVSNPYGNGGASDKVVEIIKTLQLDGLTQKYFYDQTYDFNHAEG